MMTFLAYDGTIYDIEIYSADHDSNIIIVYAMFANRTATMALEELAYAKMKIIIVYLCGLYRIYVPE
ncbi:unnamed protein product [Rotaria socialis]